LGTFLTGARTEAIAGGADAEHVSYEQNKARKRGMKKIPIFC